MSDVLFDDPFEREVQKRLQQEIEKLSDNPDAVIAAYSAKVAKLQGEIDSMAPLVDFAETVMQSDDWSEMSTVSKLVGRKGWGRNNVFGLLRDRGVLRYNNEPYQSYVERGYFKVVEQHWQNPNTGETMVSKKTVVSQRGIDFIRRMIDEAY